MHSLNAASGPWADHIERLGPWYHNLRLPDGSQTAPEHFLGDFPRMMWEQFALELPDDMSGWRVLDIGCNAGFYSFALAQRGATVTGIDVDEHYLAQARWVADVLELRDQVSFRRMTVYDLAHQDDTYDLVLFTGVLYHLRYPLLGLDIVAEKVRRLLIFQTLTTLDDSVVPTPANMPLSQRRELSRQGWPAMAFIEHRMQDDPTNWWAANHAGVQAMLRSTGMRIVKHLGEEVYFCEPAAQSPRHARWWDQDELDRACGRGK